MIFDNTTTPSTAGTDVFGDTIDDYHNSQAGLPPDQPWGASYAANSSYWQDLTADGTCNSLALDDCVYQDKITGLSWSEVSNTLDFSGIAGGSWPCGGTPTCTQASGNVTAAAGGTYAANADLRWWDAIYACDQLSFAGQTDWRLPTQKEMMEAVVHGIRSVASANWIDGSSNTYWSASTGSLGTTLAWAVALGYGATFNNGKTTTGRFVCVR